MSKPGLPARPARPGAHLSMLHVRTVNSGRLCEAQPSVTCKVPRPAVFHSRTVVLLSRNITWLLFLLGVH